MAIEEEFFIEIPASAAESLLRLGDMHDFIVRTLRQRGEKPDEMHIWERLSAVVIDQLGVRPEEVTRSAHIIKDLRAD